MHQDGGYTTNRAKGDRHVGLWLILLCLLSLVPAAAMAGDILLVKSANTALYDKAENAFHTELARTCLSGRDCPSVTTILSKDLKQYIGADYRLLVLIGQKASAAAFAQKMTAAVRQLHIMVSKKNYSQITGCCDRTSAIFLEQPLERQLGFIAFILPERKRIGVLLGEYSTHYREELQDQANRMGLELFIREVDSAEHIGKLLYELRHKVDLLLSLPDPTIYNRNTLSNILLTTYRHQIPVIGFSKGLVKSGALAALYSTAEKIGVQAVAVAYSLLQGEADFWWAPTDYSVSVNRKVARSLRLNLPADKEIFKQWSEK